MNRKSIAMQSELWNAKNTFEQGKMQLFFQINGHTGIMHISLLFNDHILRVMCRYESESFKEFKTNK